MRAYKIISGPTIRAANLSKEALRRLEWIDWYFTHKKNVSLTCRHFSISRDTFYLWLHRYNRKKLNTLEFNTKTRRPHHLREMTTSSQVLKRIYDIRSEDLEKSKYEIHEELKREGVMVAHNVIQKVINRHTELLNTQHKKKVKKHRQYKIARIKAAKELREKSLGSLIQIDTKYMTVLSRTYYLFSAVDCKSRFAFMRCYSTISSTSSQDFLKRLNAYMPFPIQAINTDNGSEYLLKFHQEVSEWGIPHYFTDPHCPKQNGRVERFHQTAEYEYFNYQDDLLDDLSMINERCEAFLIKYNTQRFHQSLGYKTPLEYVIMLLSNQPLPVVRYL
jgi:transposase InsO family protein